ncbi:hypothetical protein [Proteiniclasticum ruminis]|uniref:Uncharacterized protein n=1 Tax=Proteiniclasticum ruminis TaxID=398199 RepID=A0A1I5DDF7_9CLOT|nr:hypothetical protein [Proteiniclasticum ruminis]SFN97166.1 hypothetical protein SAMN04488695_1094 [Proteiniclasticum ruminis]
MHNEEKKDNLRLLLEKDTSNESHYYYCLQRFGDLNGDYRSLLSTDPINVDIELLRLPDANYELCVALLIMLLRESHWIEGSFERRYRNGEVQQIISKMITLL